MIGRIRTAFRLAMVGLHVVCGLGIVTAIYPFVARSTRRRLQQGWSRRLLAILGVRLEVTGRAQPSGLLVANHISWLDIFVIGSIAPASFVCKSEIRSWPLIGLLCARTDTIFLERGSRSAARRVNQTLSRKLGNGEVVAVFPEGTTSEGASLLPFHAALLQSAIDTESWVMPLALRYRDMRGQQAVAVAYCGETSFWQSLCAIASAPRLSASVDILETVATAGKTRKALCAELQTLIGSCLAHSTREPAPEVPLYLRFRTQTS
ncbi:MAG: lysophospholipid acyltransferase family protein [Sterolibacterium sp.]